MYTEPGDFQVRLYRRRGERRSELPEPKRSTSGSFPRRGHVVALDRRRPHPMHQAAHAGARVGARLYHHGRAGGRRGSGHPEIPDLPGLTAHVFIDEARSPLAPRRLSPALKALARTLARQHGGHDAVHLEGHFLWPILPSELRWRSVFGEQNIELVVLEQRRLIGEEVGVDEVGRASRRRAARVAPSRCHDRLDRGGRCRDRREGAGRFPRTTSSMNWTAPTSSYPPSGRTAA